MAKIRRPVRPVDDVWLAMDQPDNLMVVEGLMVVAGDLDRETYLELVRTRVVDPFPRFRQRPRWEWLPWPGRWWEDDPDFDLERHVLEVDLPSPDDAALQHHLAGCMSRPLDFDHPPWEVHLLRGHHGGTAVYTRLHHALADGTALLRVVLSLCDEEARVDARADGGPVRRLTSAVRAVPGAGRLVTAPAVAEHLLLARRPDSPLAVPPHHAKLAVWAPPIDIDRLRPLRRATSTTVTDVMMAALAGALRRWLLDHGADVTDDVPTMVPVDLRGAAALRPDDLGNQFALVLLDLPVATDTALGRLLETTRRMSALKSSPEAWLTYAMLQGMGLVHPRVRVRLTDFFAHKATGVTTSVHGPDQGLHLAGLPVTRLWAWAPMSADQSLSTSIIGYAGEVHVGFKVDAAAVPDPDRLVAGLVAEIEDLVALVPDPPSPQGAT